MEREKDLNKTWESKLNQRFQFNFDARDSRKGSLRFINQNKQAKSDPVHWKLRNLELVLNG